MDTDLSHEAITRFESIEQRLNVLEGNAEPTDNEEVVEETDTETEEAS